MQICFILSDLRVPSPAGALRIEGTRTALSVVIENHGGLFYPHVAQEISPEAYRFFAGRLYAVPPSATLPTGHPVSSMPVDDWTFESAEPDGSWIALKFDRKRDLLSAAADVFIVQRWFYYRSGDTIYLSNSLRFLFKISGAEAPIEERAVPYMLGWGYLPCHITPLKDVFELDAGEVLTARDGKYSVTQRKTLPVYRRPVSAERDQILAIGDVLAASVKECLSGLDRIVLPLSGGIDSRFLLGCALEAMDPAQITTITFGNPGSWDLEFGLRVARFAGVNAIRLETDLRPIGQILRDNFAVSEGMYSTVPDYPVTSFHAALPEGTSVLSGYIGDPVFGAKEKGPEFESAAAGHDADLDAIYQKTASVVPWETVRPLLTLPQRDPLGIAQRYAGLPGATLQERLDFWYFGPHTTNRSHYAVAPARYKAFFLTPFISGSVLDIAFSMPVAARRKRAAYFAALKKRYPKLYAFRTTNNYGFPLDTPRGLRVNAARAWCKLWAEFDDRIGGATGTILYRHPRQGFHHPREFQRAIHRRDILQCVDDLRALSVFDRQALDRFRDQIARGRGANLMLARYLLTVQQWMLNYRK